MQSSGQLIDYEVKDNQITIGNVSVELDEGDFDPDEPHDIVPGSRLEKAPKLTNDGSKDEFVFMKITVPIDSATFLYEADDGVNQKGTPNGLAGRQQMFRFIANAPVSPAADNVKSVTAPEGREVDFKYHSDDADGETVDGWILLDSKYSRSKTVEGTTTYYDEYVFGYNKKLRPNEETLTLFDEVQLKSFIDREIVGGTEIGVVAYGIQADNLKPEGEIDFTKQRFSEQEIQAIYTIVKNKANE